MSQKTEVVTLRTTPKERADIARLAQVTERSVSDALRWAAREILRQMDAGNAQSQSQAQPHYAPTNE